MILEYSLDYRSSSLVYEKIFLKTLKSLSLNGKIIKNHFQLNLYVAAETIEELETFATLFTKNLPHSIFLYDTKAQIIDTMPKEEGYILPKMEKSLLSFCPSCLHNVMNEEGRDYYNIFKECEVCGYGVVGENRSYKKEFQNIVNRIKEGEVVELNTFYQKYFIGIPNKICNSLKFDIITYDLATIEKYTNAKEYELSALGSFEKPFLKLKKSMKFIMDFEDIEAELIRFKLPDDFIFHLLMEELHKVDIDAIFITEEQIDVKNKLILVEPKEVLEPIEIVASEKNIAIINGKKGLPKLSISEQKFDDYNFRLFHSVIEEHQLDNENIVGINLSKKYANNILVYGKKYGTIEYLSLNFKFESINDIFNQIKSTNETGEKIVKNFKNKFEEHYEKISKITFDKHELNIYQLWGVISIILEFSDSKNLFQAANVLEESAMSFLGNKGPRIDYKLENINGKVYLDPLMTIRTAMSFKLADVDQMTLCYGVVESFCEFLANELDEIKQSMDTTAVTVAGSLLENSNLFAKINKEISVNHNIYFNNELAVESFQSIETL
jgi:hypothetical protein